MKRPYLKPDGTTIYVELPECKCKDRRGPKNGVCGNCGGAIP